VSVVTKMGITKKSRKSSRLRMGDDRVRERGVKAKKCNLDGFGKGCTYNAVPASKKSRQQYKRKKGCREMHRKGNDIQHRGIEEGERFVKWEIWKKELRGLQYGHVWQLKMPGQRAI